MTTPHPTVPDPLGPLAYAITASGSARRAVATAVRCRIRRSFDGAPNDLLVRENPRLLAYTALCLLAGLVNPAPAEWERQLDGQVRRHYGPADSIWTALAAARRLHVAADPSTGARAVTDDDKTLLPLLDASDWTGLADLAIDSIMLAAELLRGDPRADDELDGFANPIRL